MALVKNIIDCSWHRNGVGGVGFYAVLFEGNEGLMIASLFDEPGYCAVYHVGMLGEKNIAFARGNSWRGDSYESELRPMVKEWSEKAGTGRMGPFSVIAAAAMAEALNEHLGK